MAEIIKRNERDIEWQYEHSPKGMYASHAREMSSSLTVEPPAELVRGGLKPQSRPFEVSLIRIPPGARYCPRHAHTAQWEYYIVLSGQGRMLQSGDPIELEPGDHLMQPPGWVHAVENSGPEELVYYVIADNPRLEIVHLPDSDKWLTIPPVRFFRMNELSKGDEGYFDGEE